MISKKESYSQQDIELAELAKALSHPARIMILRTIAEQKTCLCGEVVEVMPLAQSTVSQHLKELKNAHLIIGEIEGLKSCYCINWQTVKKLIDMFQHFNDSLNKHCC
jgi:ArsR family transcriptional regulator